MRFLIPAALALASVAAPAHALGVFLIDFEDQAAPALVAQPLVYPDASFTTPGDLFVISFVTNSLCPSFGPTCLETLTVDFANKGPIFLTTNVSFTVAGDDSLGVTGSVDVFRDAVLLGTANIVTDADPSTQDIVDLSAFGDVTRLVINTVDPAGLVYDNFRYDILVVDPAPAPAALGLLGLGVVALGLRRR